jgi:hypothetical protein
MLFVGSLATHLSGETKSASSNIWGSSIPLKLSAGDRFSKLEQALVNERDCGGSNQTTFVKFSGEGGCERCSVSAGCMRCVSSDMCIECESGYELDS